VVIKEEGDSIKSDDEPKMNSYIGLSKLKFKKNH